MRGRPHRSFYRMATTFRRSGEHDDAPPRSSPARFARGQLVDVLSVQQHTRPRAVHATPCSRSRHPFPKSPARLARIVPGDRYYLNDAYKRSAAAAHREISGNDVPWKPSSVRSTSC
ncbi:hypothetical protein PUN28_004117 [Cardiocondyla obscurior]|uniref:Uncharacterized protein n=1 Tax=Cardiocondyla obscurior TaxID=286306 RepID=A0AAW2GPN2_9HYME